LRRFISTKAIICKEGCCCSIKYKNIIKEIIIFFLIVNFYCASRSLNLKGKAPFPMSKQAGLSIRSFEDGRKNG
jgi:hypothetical protein